MSDFFPVDGRPDRASVKRTLVLVFVIALVLGNLGGGVAGVVGALGTGAHEAGHAVFGDLLTGRVTSMTVFREGGGVTFTEVSDSWWRTFLVAGSGYPATLFAGLALLTAVLFGQATRVTAAVAAGISAFVWVFWVPFNSKVGFVSDGEQRFTWFLIGVTTLVFAAVAAIPDRYEQARRVGLGVLAVGLLTDAFSAGRTLVIVEGSFGETASDADALSQAVGVGSSAVWAWLLRGSLFVIAFLWARWALNRAGRPAPPYS
ncbi:MAG TPA: M50 family metallopeptidase [Acidimicrobiales bacterium]|nr:M50 family metallopeptidase [Acidimicrobiales bacterium]